MRRVPQSVAQTVVDMSQDGDAVGVVDFDDQAHLLYPLKTITESERCGVARCVPSVTSWIDNALPSLQCPLTPGDLPAVALSETVTGLGGGGGGGQSVSDVKAKGPLRWC